VPKAASVTGSAALAKTDAAPVKSGAEIEKDIRARLVKSKIGADNFQVHVKGGAATLDGKTNVIQDKGVASRLARSSGRVAVANHVEISEAPGKRRPKTWQVAGGEPRVKPGEGRSETPTARQSR
jgi:hypothetical protein